jgi:hypothetical protein
MEAIAAISSIAGILSLAIQGIQAIQTLRNFYQHCTDEAAKDFLHELSVSARILHDVKSLCDKMGNIDSGNQIRVASLQVQLEDCIADLESWLMTAKRIDQTPRRHDQGRSTPAKQFVTLFNAVYRKKVMVLSVGRRLAVRERFQRHQKNVETALSVLQMYKIHIK